MTTAVDASSQLLTQRPEVSRFWIRHSFRNWNASSRWWTNLATGSLGEPGSTGRTVPTLEPARVDGLLYVPPVGSAQREERQRLVASVLAGGGQVLVGLHAGENPRTLEGVTRVYDLLPVLLEGRLDDLEQLPAGSTVVWPLISGLTDHPALWRDACSRLAAAGVRCAQSMQPTLGARQRRLLATEFEQDGKQLFESLFHRDPPAERRFAQVAHQFGLRPFVSRPVAEGGERHERNQRLSELLSVAAEVWLGLGRSEAQGQVLFRSSRWAEETAVDIQALVLEGNLEIIAWLGPPASTMIQEWAETGSSATLTCLVEEYVGGWEKGNHGEPD